MCGRQLLLTWKLTYGHENVVDGQSVPGDYFDTQLENYYTTNTYWKPSHHSPTNENGVNTTGEQKSDMVEAVTNNANTSLTDYVTIQNGGPAPTFDYASVESQGLEMFYRAIINLKKNDTVDSQATHWEYHEDFAGAGALIKETLRWKYKNSTTWQRIPEGCPVLKKPIYVPPPTVCTEVKKISKEVSKISYFFEISKHKVNNRTVIMDFLYKLNTGYHYVVNIHGIHEWYTENNCSVLKIVDANNDVPKDLCKHEFAGNFMYSNVWDLNSSGERQRQQNSTGNDKPGIQNPFTNPGSWKIVDPTAKPYLKEYTFDPAVYTLVKLTTNGKNKHLTCTITTTSGTDTPGLVVMDVVNDRYDCLNEDDAYEKDQLTTVGNIQIIHF